MAGKPKMPNAHIKRIFSILSIAIILFTLQILIPFKFVVEGQPTPQNFAVHTLGKTALIVGSYQIDPVSLIQLKRLLEHKGLLYDIVSDSNISELTKNDFNLLFVLGLSQPQFRNMENHVKSAVENGTGLIWIAGTPPALLQDLLGISVESTPDNPENAAGIRYGSLFTQIFDETINLVHPKDAETKGYFEDDLKNQLAPAEISNNQNQLGRTYYFAYDVLSWWSADLKMPWLRASRISLAIEDTLSKHLTVRLSPFPYGLHSVFITRIEDVDPLHTDPEWLNRANKFLEHYADRHAPLTVGLIPRYIDLQAGINVQLGAITASELRDFLSNTLQRGGTILQHGYTHQIGEGKTGISPEFYDETTQTWLSLQMQKQRIAEGSNEITKNLGFKPKGFEAPHYIANEDTYKALKELGYEYISQNTETPFFDHYNETGLVDIPETLGYIPLEATGEIEANIKKNMDLINELQGIMLVFNHLFDETAFKIGQNLLEYALSKEGVWITDTDNLASFWSQRFNAYQKMTIDVTPDEIVVKLGRSDRAGLTLAFTKGIDIKNVNINGIEYPTFKENQIILPALTETNNTITINLTEQAANSNAPYGILTITITTAVSAIIALQTIYPKKINETLNKIRGKQK